MLPLDFVHTNTDSLNTTTRVQCLHHPQAHHIISSNSSCLSICLRYDSRWLHASISQNGRSVKHTNTEVSSLLLCCCWHSSTHGPEPLSMLSIDPNAICTDCCLRCDTLNQVGHDEKSVACSLLFACLFVCMFTLYCRGKLSRIEGKQESAS